MKKKPKLKLKLGDIYTDGNIDPVTGKPYYYKVNIVDPKGRYVASIGCDEKGNTRVIEKTLNHSNND